MFKALVILLILGVFLTHARPSEGEGKRLIKTSETKPAKWLTQEQIYSLIEKKVGFIDVTGRAFPQLENTNKAQRKALPTTLRFGPVVTEAIQKIDVQRIESFITAFSEYHNRHYQSATGEEAVNWLISQINESIESSNYDAASVTVQPFSHTWRQPSVIVRFEGVDETLKSEVVVLGAHLDSIVGGLFPINMAAPGADDNASGSAVLLETVRALLLSNVAPKRTIELQWYAAEEVGLRGSGDIAQAYDQQGVNVISMLNFDVVGYYTEGRNEISFLTDYTSDDLNAFLRTCVEGYLSVPWMDSTCGYGCSDHASWTEIGVPAASPSEPVLSPNMHTIRDVISTVSFEQVAEFAKLATAYAIEIAEPNQA